VLPRYGVYIGYLRPEGEKATPNIINIGLHPTLPDGTVTVEAHMLEENENLYGRKAEVLLMDFLRPETRFDSKEALTAQIAKDRETALAWFAAHAR
jgi:riboflavin kinase/FMN adenylyltransferase